MLIPSSSVVHDPSSGSSGVDTGDSDGASTANPNSGSSVLPPEDLNFDPPIFPHLQQPRFTVQDHSAASTTGSPTPSSFHSVKYMKSDGSMGERAVPHGALSVVSGITSSTTRLPPSVPLQQEPRRLLPPLRGGLASAVLNSTPLPVVFSPPVARPRLIQQFQSASPTSSTLGGSFSPIASPTFSSAARTSLNNPYPPIVGTAGIGPNRSGAQQGLSTAPFTTLKRLGPRRGLSIPPSLIPPRQL